MELRSRLLLLSAAHYQLESHSSAPLFRAGKEPRFRGCTQIGVADPRARSFPRDPRCSPGAKARPRDQDGEPDGESGPRRDGS